MLFSVTTQKQPNYAVSKKLEYHLRREGDPQFRITPHIRLMATLAQDAIMQQIEDEGLHIPVHVLETWVSHALRFWPLQQIAIQNFQRTNALQW